MPFVPGCKNMNRKLSDAEVRAIRSARGEEKMAARGSALSYKALAARYGVCIYTIFCVCQRIRYREVTD